MFNLDHWKRLALMGIKFDVDPGTQGGAGGGTDPAPATDPAKTDPPKPADPNAAPSQQGQQQSTQETPEQKIARLEADNARLEREKDNVRIQQEGAKKQEAKREELLNVAKLAGITIEDPAKETIQTLTEKLTGKVMKGDESSSELQDTKRELAIVRLAVTERVDPDKLTNRVSFVNAAKALDPTASDFNDKLKALIQAEATNDPSIKSGGTGTTTSGADQYGGAGGGQITQEQFDKMSFAERSALYKANPQLHDRLAN